jgi:hypothetical protein
LEYRATTAPLDQIGHFLVEVGETVLNLFDSTSSSSSTTNVSSTSDHNSSYYCSTQVTKLQQFQFKNQSLWRIVALNSLTKSHHEIYARYVVLASGGKQSLPQVPPPLNSSSTSSSSSSSSKLFTSDFVCTDLGIQELTQKLKNYPRKRIVIIGGSHSAFSAAWICLNKLGWNKSASDSSSSHSIYLVHRHDIKVFYACKRDADRDKYVSYEGINKQGQIHPFSGLRGDAKALYRNIRAGIETRVRYAPCSPLCVSLNLSQIARHWTRWHQSPIAVHSSL